MKKLGILVTISVLSLVACNRKSTASDEGKGGTTKAPATTVTSFKADSEAFTKENEVNIICDPVPGHADETADCSPALNQIRQFLAKNEGLSLKALRISQIIVGPPIWSDNESFPGSSYFGFYSSHTTNKDDISFSIFINRSSTAEQLGKIVSDLPKSDSLVMKDIDNLAKSIKAKLEGLAPDREAVVIEIGGLCFDQVDQQKIVNCTEGHLKALIETMKSTLTEVNKKSKVSLQSIKFASKFRQKSLVEFDNELNELVIEVGSSAESIRAALK